MAVELGSVRLGEVFGRMLHRGGSSLSSNLFSERARERREAYERKDFRTYVGNVHLGLQDSDSGSEDWSFKETAPVRPLNPEPNVVYGDHVLKTGDYLTIHGDRGLVLWEGVLKFYPDGGGYRHPLGVEEEYLFRLFNNGCPAELRTSVKPDSATAGAGETARLHKKVSERIQDNGVIILEV